MLPSTNISVAAMAQEEFKSIILQINTSGNVSIIGKGGNALGSNWVFASCTYPVV